MKRPGGSHPQPPGRFKQLDLLRNRELDLGHIRLIVLAQRLGAFQVDFAVGTDHRVAVGLDPAPEGLVGPTEHFVRSFVDDAGHCGGRQLVDPDARASRHGTLQVNHCLAIDIADLILIIVPDGRVDQGAWIDVDMGQVLKDFAEQAANLWIAGEPVAHTGDQLSIDLFENYVVVWHTPLHIDRLKPGFDAHHARLPIRDLLLQLRALESQHAAQLFRRNPFIEYLADLLEREAQVLEREDAVEPGKLVHRVIAIPGLAVNADRLEESHLVVIAQRLDRDPAQLREISNAYHRLLRHGFPMFSSCFYPDSTISRYGRVKRFADGFLLAA